MSRRARNPAELERQKLARQRFRSLIRSVVYNRIWLNDAEDMQKLSMNVKRNVAMLVRRKHKIGVLTMAEKALIRTPHSLRSLEDRKELLKLVTGLQCFSKLAPQVRARLCAVIKFLYLGIGRIIIREGQFPDTIYFILYGEVEASRKVYDPIKGEIVDKVEFIYGAGDCIGDIEMIEKCPRKHTYTATSVVELLVVFSEDYDELLKGEMTKQWLDKQAAIKALGYFDHFNYEQNIYANKLSVLREFDALETIYYQDKGEASYAYFVLSGECMILQSLQLKVREKWGIKSYELMDVSKSDKDDKFTRKNALQVIKETDEVTRSTYDIDQLLESDEERENELARIKQALKVMDLRRIEIQCGIRKASESSAQMEEIQSEHSLEEHRISSLYLKEEDYFKLKTENLESQESEDIEGIEEHSSKEMLYFRTKPFSLKQPMHEDQPNSKQPSVVNNIEEKPKEALKFENAVKTVEEFKSQTRESDADRAQKSGSLSSVGQKNRLSKTSFKSQPSSAKLSKSNSSQDRVSKVSKTSKSSISRRQPIYSIETRFIDVGSLTFGAIFGLGEKFEDRVIMARTKVQCLLIPRFWLFEKEQNPGRIWQRRRFVVDTGIPSRMQLYRDFLNTRKWQKYKNDFISSILDPNSKQNETHIEDIPMMFHIINPIEE